MRLKDPWGFWEKQILILTKSSASLLTSLIRYVPPYVFSRSNSIPTCTLASFPVGLRMRLTLIPASTHILTQLHCYYHYLMQAYTHTSTSIIPYSGKLSEEKTFANLMFCSTKFGGMTLFGDTCGQFMTVFSCESFPLYSTSASLWFSFYTQGYIRGYISHQHQKLVVSKQNPFPVLSSVLK